MRGWLRRTGELRAELAAIAEADARWWLLAGGAAAAELAPPRTRYLISNGEPGADTFIGHLAPAPRDWLGWAIARARAAQTVLRELDGELPDQPLAVTVRRDDAGARAEACELAHVAFAIGGRAWWAALPAARDGAERERADRELRRALVTAIAGNGSLPPAPLRPVGDGPTPFATISLGDEAIETARHGHRRGWHAGRRGPWLGIARAGGMDIVSTCHMIVDGYGHAWLSARIGELARTDDARGARDHDGVPRPLALPPLAAVDGAVALGVAWHELPRPSPRALPLAFALARALHRANGRPDAAFSPTLQIPVAPGTSGDAASDELRRRRRVVPAVVSVRFARGEPEPFAAFDARTRAVLAREAQGHGLSARLLAAGRAAPTPIAWKRRAASTERPLWLDRFADVLGGRGCVSRIRLAVASPPACAVSSPARMPSPRDPLGACVITIVDDGARAAITACGSGELAGDAPRAHALLAEILAHLTG